METHNLILPRSIIKIIILLMHAQAKVLRTLTREAHSSSKSGLMSSSFSPGFCRKYTCAEDKSSTWNQTSSGSPKRINSSFSYLSFCETRGWVGGMGELGGGHEYYAVGTPRAAKGIPLPAQFLLYITYPHVQRVALCMTDEGGKR